MTRTTHLNSSVFKFLTDLSKNNDRHWFSKNKSSYISANEHFKALAEEINEGMQMQDHIEKMKLYRIYRDVRFSKNKAPYKNNFGLGFSRASAALRGGYYFQVQPGGNSFMGGGFWQPNTADLQRIREEIAIDSASFEVIIHSPSFKKYFGNLGGQQLKTAPRGFPKDHPAIELLRHKSFIVTKHFTDEEVTTPGFTDELLKYFKATRPFFDYMSEVLTTDSNGVSLLE